MSATSRKPDDDDKAAMDDLRAKLKAANISQVEITEVLGKSGQQISKYLRGLSVMSVGKYFRVERYISLRSPVKVIDYDQSTMTQSDYSGVSESNQQAFVHDGDDSSTAIAVIEEIDDRLEKLKSLLTSRRKRQQGEHLSEF